MLKPSPALWLWSLLRIRPQMQAWGPQLLSVPCLLIHTPTTPAGSLGGPGSPAPCPQAVPAPGALGPQGGFSFSPSFAYETSICHVGSQLYLELQASVPTFTLSCPLPHPSHGDGQWGTEGRFWPPWYWAHRQQGNPWSHNEIGRRQLLIEASVGSHVAYDGRSGCWAWQGPLCDRWWR